MASTLPYLVGQQCTSQKWRWLR